MERLEAEINKVAPNGRTALMLAATSGDVDTVRLLCGAGADVSLQFDGVTAKSIAEEKGFKEVSAALLDCGGGANGAGEL